MEEIQIGLGEALYILLVGTILSYVTFLVAMRLKFYTFPYQENEEGSLPFRLVLISFLLFFLTSGLVVPLLFKLQLYLYEDVNKALTEDKLLALSNLSIIATFLTFIVYNYCLSKKNQRLIHGSLFGPKIGFKKTVQDVLIGVSSWFMSYPLLLVFGKLIFIFLYFFGIETVPDQIAVSQVKSALLYPREFLILAFNVIFIVPILEEFVFRGNLQTWMKSKMDLKYAIMLTSIIFALFHFSWTQGFGNIELMSSLFILSCFLGFIYERQKSLLASISLHAFFNAVTVAIITMS